VCDQAINLDGVDGGTARYFVLMVYQRYHTWADILTTAAIIAPPLIIGRWRLARHHAGQIV
jgi:hypothetical protein